MEEKRTPATWSERETPDPLGGHSRWRPDDSLRILHVTVGPAGLPTKRGWVGWLKGLFPCVGSINYSVAKVSVKFIRKVQNSVIGSVCPSNNYLCYSITGNIKNEGWHGYPISSYQWVPLSCFLLVLQRKLVITMQFTLFAFICTMYILIYLMGLSIFFFKWLCLLIGVKKKKTKLNSAVKPSAF